MKDDVANLKNMFLDESSLTHWAKDVQNDFGEGRSWELVREMFIIAREVLNEEL